MPNTRAAGSPLIPTSPYENVAVARVTIVRTGAPIASNTPMFGRVPDDVDVCGGTMMTGVETVEPAGTRIFAAFLAAASGAATKSETFDDGDDEFVPWQVGAVV